MGRDTWKKGFSKPLNVKISVAFPLGDSPASLKAIGTCDIRLQSNVTLEYRPSAAPGLFLKKKTIVIKSFPPSCVESGCAALT